MASSGSKGRETGIYKDPLSGKSKVSDWDRKPVPEIIRKISCFRRLELCSNLQVRISSNGLTLSPSRPTRDESRQNFLNHRPPNSSTLISKMSIFSKCTLYFFYHIGLNALVQSWPSPPSRVDIARYLLCAPSSSSPLKQKK